MMQPPGSITGVGSGGRSAGSALRHRAPIDPTPSRSATRDLLSDVLAPRSRAQPAGAAGLVLATRNAAVVRSCAATLFDHAEPGIGRD